MILLAALSFVLTADFSSKPLAVDGAFEDWPETRPARIESADLSVAHDARNLYLAIRQDAPAPLELRFRDGEKAFDLRLDASRVSIRRAGGEWVEPKSLISAVTPGGAEIAVPWKMLGYAAAPKRFACSAQSVPDRAVAVDFVQPPPMQVGYTLPKSASVSLGVFDATGRLLRTLVKDEPRPAGENAESWDGLDQWGNLFAPGTYTLKGIHHDPFKLDYLMSATTPGTPGWWTADGTGGWLSDEAAPQAVVTDGTTVYIAAPYAEAGHSLIAVGPDGKRIWGANLHGYCPRATSLAILGDRIYVSYSGPELTSKTVRHFTGAETNVRERVMVQCFDRRTGELAGPSAKKNAYVTVEAWKYRHDIHALWDLRLKKTYSPQTYGGYHRYCNTGMCETTGSLGLAAAGDKLVLSLLYSGELIVLDSETLEIEKRIPVPEPAGLHGLDANTVLAVSGKTVVKVDLPTGKITPVVTAGLSAPFGVTTDKSGAVYVSDWGDSFQVKRFKPNGRLAQSYGVPGGRPWIGPFTPEGMQVPRGIAVTDDGRLWVAEDEFSPRRVSVWNVKTGKLVRDYIGPANYQGWGLLFDPADPTRILTCGTEFKLDLDKKTTTPVRKMFLRRSRNDCFMPDGNEMAGGGCKILRRGGKEFLVLSTRYGVRILQRKDEEYRPVAAIQGFEAHGGSIDGTDKAFWDSDLLTHHLPGWYPEFFKGQQGNNHIWNDADGDGEVQASEIVFDKSLRRGDRYEPGRFGELSTAWCVGVGNDFSIYMRGFCRDASIVYRFDPVFGADGFPQYSFARAKPIVVKQPPEEMNLDNIYMSASDRLYLTYPNNIPREIISKNAIVCRDRDGKELWSLAGPKDNGPKSLYGYPCAEFDYPGLGRGVATWVWWHNCRVYLLAEDGLYVGGFLDNTDSSTGPEYVRPGAEVSCFAHQLPDGRFLIVNGYGSAHHIFELKGLDTAKRFEKTFTVTPEAVAAAEKRLKEAVSAPVRNQPAIIAGCNRDTLPAELVTLRKAGRGAKISLRTDGTHLLVSADVRDETPMMNDGSNWQTPFITGDCVDIQLGTDPAADPARRAPAPGDVRLVLTELRGEPLAVLYRPVVPGTQNPVQFLATMIDDVRRLPKSCSPVIARTKGGYTLRAKIPLAELGFTGGVPRDLLRGDVGVIYSDATGRDRDQRLCYYNRNTAIVSDLTTEASLAPDAWGPVLFELPGNLIADGDFEDDALKLWKIGPQQNGATVRVADDQSFGGGRALCLMQAEPIQMPPNPESYSKDHGALYKLFNGGKGGGYTLADWRVPVTGGAAYDLRFAVRSQNTMREQRGGRPGYALMMMFASWFDKDGKCLRNFQAVYRLESDVDWRIERNPRNSHSEIPGTPFVAPEGAVEVLIRAQMAVNYDLQTRFWLDQVEFAPVQPK